MVSPGKGIKDSLCPKNDCKLSTVYHGHYVIPGNPVPLKRPRFGNKQVWDSQRQLRVNTGIYLHSQHEGRPLFKGPLQLECFFYIGVPASYSQKRRDKVLGTPHIYKPDLSNLIKLIEDIGTGILYHDDALIYSLQAFKLYDQEGRTEFILQEIPDPSHV